MSIRNQMEQWLCHIIPPADMPDLSGLTTPQVFAIKQWAQDYHLSADPLNDPLVLPAPFCLRQRLKEGHWLRTWKVIELPQETKGGGA